MSHIGSDIAINAAQVAHNAQRAARAQDKGRADTQRTARQHGDKFVERLHAAAQADDPDAEMPDRQPLGYEQLYLQDPDGQPLADPPAPVEPDDLAELYHQLTDHPPAHPLYQHLDITA